MKYGCSDAHESPTTQRCASESWKVREDSYTCEQKGRETEEKMDLLWTWTHVLLKKTPVKIVESSAIMGMIRIVIIMILIIRRQRYKNAFNYQEAVRMNDQMVLQVFKVSKWKIPPSARTNPSTLKGAFYSMGKKIIHVFSQITLLGGSPCFTAHHQQHRVSSLCLKKK